MQKHILMKLGYDFRVLSKTDSNLRNCLHAYRRHFLKRKNINQYKRQKKGTHKVISNLINAFDRKINKVPIFTDEIKKEYLKGINTIFANYYDLDFEYLPMHWYYTYCADQWLCYRNTNPISFKKFKEQGIYKIYYKYKKH
jgi:hypothetical protein